MTTVENVAEGSQQAVSLNELVTDKEKVYFGIILAFNIVVVLLCVLSIVFIPYIIGFALFSLIMQGLFLGYLQGNAVKLSQKQYPEVFEMAQELTLKLGLNKMPDFYLLESGGLLNAAASKFMSRDFVIIYSDVLEAAYQDQDGMDALKFIIAHELVHVKRDHVFKHMALSPANFTPLLGVAYSRACERTCDIISTHLVPEGAIKGLSLLCAGKGVYKRLNLDEFLENAKDDNGIWSEISEYFATHPHLFKRLACARAIVEPNNATVY